MPKVFTYEELQRRIAEIQAQADRVRKVERVSVINNIRESMKNYDITADELMKTARRTSPKKSVPAKVHTKTIKPRRSKPSKTTSARAARFRNPVTGETWSGIGGHPMWVRALLRKQGQRPAPMTYAAFVEKYLIDKSQIKNNILTNERNRVINRNRGGGGGGKGKLRPRYIHPKTGATWLGGGAKPQWMLDELAKGKKMEDFLNPELYPEALAAWHVRADKKTKQPPEQQKEAAAPPHKNGNGKQQQQAKEQE